MKELLHLLRETWNEAKNHPALLAAPAMMWQYRWDSRRHRWVLR